MRIDQAVWPRGLPITTALFILALLASTMMRTTPEPPAGGPQARALSAPLKIPTFPEPENESTVTDLVVFHQVNFEHGQVVTGIRYSDVKSAEIGQPDAQWCYFSAGSDPEGSRRDIDLATWFPLPGTTVDVDVSAKAARRVGLDVADVPDASSLCQFMGRNSQEETRSDEQ